MIESYVFTVTFINLMHSCWIKAFISKRILMCSALHLQHNIDIYNNRQTQHLTKLITHKQLYLSQLFEDIGWSLAGHAGKKVFLSPATKPIQMVWHNLKRAVVSGQPQNTDKLYYIYIFHSVILVCLQCAVKLRVKGFCATKASIVLCQNL